MVVMAKSKQRKKKDSRKRQATVAAKQSRSRERRESEERIERFYAHRAALADPSTSPEAIAQIVVDDYGDARIELLDISATLRSVSLERLPAVAEAIEALAPGSWTARMVAVFIAVTVDSDLELARSLVFRMVDEDDTCETRVALARTMGAVGGAAVAYGWVRSHLEHDPDDDEAEESAGEILEKMHRDVQRDVSGGAHRDEALILAEFADRTPMYALREEVADYVTGSRWSEIVVDWTARWLAEAISDEPDEDLGWMGEGQPIDHLLAWASEMAWHSASESPDPSADAESPIDAFAAEGASSEAVAALAAEYADTFQCGLWLVADPVPAPGVWMLDIVTGMRRYVEMPPEQASLLARWSVVLGAVVRIEGVWRTASTLMSMSPPEGDRLATEVFEAITELGPVQRGRKKRKVEAQPWGVLAEVNAPLAPEDRAVVAVVIALLVPRFLKTLSERRSRSPEMINTDRDPMLFITAKIEIDDKPEVLAALAEYHDVSPDNDGGFIWHGRRLTDLERKTSRAEVARSAGIPLSEVIDDPDQRYVRCHIRRTGSMLDAEVNSEARFAGLLELLSGIGAQPRVMDSHRVDPAQDMVIPSGGIRPAVSPEAHEAWMRAWVDDEVPALGGLTPREAAEHDEGWAWVESLLRQFEHEADRTSMATGEVRDLGWLRTELELPIE